MRGEASKDARAGVRAEKKPEKSAGKPMLEASIVAGEAAETWEEKRKASKTDKKERRTPLEKKKRQIIERMQQLGTYRVQYMAAINRTAELYLELDALVARYEAEGREAVVEYTNKAGATNMTKNPVRSAIDDVYSQLLAHERELGLTPAAMKKLDEGATKPKAESPLARAMRELKSG